MKEVQEHNERVAQQHEGDRDLIRAAVDAEWQRVCESTARALVAKEALQSEAAALGGRKGAADLPATQAERSPLYLGFSRLRLAVAVCSRERATLAAKAAVQPRQQWFARCQRRLETFTAKRMGDVDGSRLLERCFRGWRALPGARLDQRRLERLRRLRAEIDPDRPSFTVDRHDSARSSLLALAAGNSLLALAAGASLELSTDSPVLVAWRRFMLGFRIARRERCRHALAMLRGYARLEWSSAHDDSSWSLADMDCCSISYELMHDPVNAMDDNGYNAFLSTVLASRDGALETKLCERRQLMKWALVVARANVAKASATFGGPPIDDAAVSQRVVDKIMELPKLKAWPRHVALRYRKTWLMAVLRMWHVQAQRQASRRGRLETQAAGEAWLPSIWRRLQLAVGISRRERHSRWAQRAAPAVGTHLGERGWLRVLLQQWRLAMLRQRRRREATGLVASASIERRRLIECAQRAACDAAVLKKERAKEFQKASQSSDYVEHESNLKDARDRLRGEEIKVRER